MPASKSQKVKVVKKPARKDTGKRYLKKVKVVEKPAARKDTRKRYRSRAEKKQRMHVPSRDPEDQRQTTEPVHVEASP